MERYIFTHQIRVSLAQFWSWRHNRLCNILLEPAILGDHVKAMYASKCMATAVSVYHVICLYICITYCSSPTIISFVSFYFCSADENQITYHWYSCSLQDRIYSRYGMMTSSNGNIFRVTGPYCWEFTGRWWIPLTKASDAELWCFLWSVPEQTVEQKMRRCRFETPSRSLWRRYNCRISFHRDALCHSIINVPAISLLSTKYTKSVSVRGPSSLVGHSHIWSMLECCFNLR